MTLQRAFHRGWPVWGAHGNALGRTELPKVEPKIADLMARRWGGWKPPASGAGPVLPPISPPAPSPSPWPASRCSDLGTVAPAGPQHRADIKAGNSTREIAHPDQPHRPNSDKCVSAETSNHSSNTSHTLQGCRSTPSRSAHHPLYFTSAASEIFHGGESNGGKRRPLHGLIQGLAAMPDVYRDGCST